MNIVILTGAGISAESGISTFRDANGLWETYRIEEVASPAAFRRDPAMVHRFYNLRRAQLKTVEPNAAHFALARLEQAWRGEFLLITQNVDDLHERAGSRKLLHMHGHIRKIRCGHCGAAHYWEEDVSVGLICDACHRGGAMRPDIVWFGEIPFGLDVCETALAQADIFIAIGTSGMVYPAASFARLCRRNKKECRRIEINPNPTGNADFSEIISDRATMAVPALVDQLLS